MLTRFGEKRFVEAIGATPVHTDDCGTLFQVPLEGDEPLTLVRVLNSTPEADGSAKPYWLRVHPELRPMRAYQRMGAPQAMTARNAVASTFGLTGDEYRPAVET